MYMPTGWVLLITTACLAGTIDATEVTVHYTVSNDRHTYDSARKNCEGHGQVLAMPKNTEETRQLNAVLRSHGKRAAWIGLIKAKQKSDYEWQDGTKLTWTDWPPGDSTTPDNPDTDLCGEFRPGATETVGAGNRNYWRDVVTTRIVGAGYRIYRKDRVTIRYTVSGQRNYRRDRVTVTELGTGDRTSRRDSVIIRNLGTGYRNYRRNIVTVKNVGSGEREFRRNTVTVRNVGGAGYRNHHGRQKVVTRTVGAANRRYRIQRATTRIAAHRNYRRQKVITGMAGSGSRNFRRDRITIRNIGTGRRNYRKQRVTTGNVDTGDRNYWRVQTCHRPLHYVCEKRYHKSCTDLCGTSGCHNNSGKLTCRCARGYLDLGEGCQDVDECSLADPACREHECVNSIGSYRCVCLDGYVNLMDTLCGKDIQLFTTEPNGWFLFQNVGFTLYVCAFISYLLIMYVRDIVRLVSWISAPRHDENTDLETASEDEVVPVMITDTGVTALTKRSGVRNCGSDR